MSFEPSPRWVRTVLGGETIASSKNVLLLREPGGAHLPVYFFPKQDVRMDLLKPSGEHWTVRAGGKEAAGAAWAREDYFAFDWNAMDHWFEEDDEVFVHPRDPYHRVDVLRSSRHIRVILGGETVAETRRPSLLFETGLPTRYYIPRFDIRMDLLTPTDSHTQCPYKGVASYWSAAVNGQTYADIVWSYPFPIPETPKIGQLLSFYNEKVDAIYVDGQAEPKPRSKWS